VVSMDVEGGAWAILKAGDVRGEGVGASERAANDSEDASVEYGILCIGAAAGLLLMPFAVVQVLALLGGVGEDESEV
jgi:hypothetical protein